MTDRREIAADDFFPGLFETALAPDELIRGALPDPERAAYAKFAHRASKYALVGVFVARDGKGVRVAVTGAGPKVFRVPAFEAALAARLARRARRDRGAAYRQPPRRAPSTART